MGPARAQGIRAWLTQRSVSAASAVQAPRSKAAERHFAGSGMIRNMSGLINSGIIYLENFVDKYQLLPSDLSRQLNYIKFLDGRIAELRLEAEYRLSAFVNSWVNEPAPLSVEANAQRLHIDGLHSQMIHLQEEKLVFCQQVEDLLRGTAAELHRVSTDLRAELDEENPFDGTFSVSEGHAGSGRGAAHHHASAPSLAQSRSGLSGLGAASMPAVPSASVGGGGGMEYGGYGSESLPAHMMAGRRGHSITSRMTPSGMGMMHQPPSTLGNPHSGMGGVMQSGYGPPRAGSGGMHPYSKQLVPPGTPNVGVSQPAPQQFFVPIDPTMQPFSPTPQSRFGRPLQAADISPALVDKQAELLWTDDHLWYLVKITHVDVHKHEADVLYVTGETENGLNLDDLVYKNEMRILPG